MPLWPSIIGGAGKARSSNFAADSLVNLYLETKSAAGEVKDAALMNTPGLKLWQVAGDGPSRGGLQQDGRGWFVMGATLYELDLVNWNVTSRGTVANDGLPVFMASNGFNGNQLGISSGGKFYVLNLGTNALSAAVSLPLTNAPVTFVYWDTFGMLLEKDTTRVWFSAVNDFTSWSSLNFFAVSVTSDNNIGMIMLRDRLWIFGSQTSKIYYNSGNASSPFVPYPGSVMQEGTVNAFCITVMGETVFWMSQDNQGQRRFVSAADAAPQRISTPAIDFALAGYPKVSDVEVLAYEQEGHPMVRWTFPHGGDAGTAWEYDVAESAKLGTPLWHQCMHWDTTLSRFDQPRPRGILSSDAGIVVGDYQNNCLYLLDLGTFTDNGDPIRRTRTAPYLSAENQYLFIDQIEQQVEQGVGSTDGGQGTDPLVMLELSRDGGHTYEPPITAPLGPSGRYDDVNRCAWFMLGRVLAYLLVIRQVMTDPVKIVLPAGLWLRATPGTGLR